MDDLLQQIGKRILTRRKQLRLTQEELAELAGITPQTVSSAELGKKALRPENIIRICSALKISTDYLRLFSKKYRSHISSFSSAKQMPTASKKLLCSAIKHLLVFVKQISIYYFSLGIGCIHYLSIPGINTHMGNVHEPPVWFITPEHKVPRL